LDLIVGNNKLTLRKADGMLATLLAVIAKRKSESGFISVVRAPDAATKA
jgi:hypothetical protein